MARKSSSALAKRGSTAITTWEKELEKDAADVAGKEQMPAGSFVSIRGGVMSIAGSPIKDNKVEVIIVDHLYENAKYDGDFDQDNPKPPVCYAFGRAEEELKPHEKSSEPQHDQCSGCAHNVFGSADKGRGKACKNVRRLALISADALSEGSIRDGQLVFLKLPVTSTKGWALYVKSLFTHYKRPPYAVVTEISVLPDPNSQFKVVFNKVGDVPASLAPALKARREKVMQEIAFPYADPPADAPKSKGKAKKGAARVTAAAAPKARKF